MFDSQKMQQLQQRSHNRGLLSKEFYQNEQAEVNRKRQEMRQQLDRQVEERKRQREIERAEQERRISKEENDIKNYYRNLDGRKGPADSGLQGSHMKYTKQPYQTYPKEGDSRAKHTQKGQRDGDIPVMSMMPIGDYSLPPAVPQAKQPQANSKFTRNQDNFGNIPLLDLSEEQSALLQSKAKKSKKPTKREKTIEGNRQINEPNKHEQSRQQQPSPIPLLPREQRQSSQPDEQILKGSIVHTLLPHHPPPHQKNNSNVILEEIEQVSSKNRALKNELKRSQQALSVLMDAVRKNGKLQKYRVKAQRIMGGLRESAGDNAQGEKGEQKEEGLMLPKIYLRHQSILHDYLLAAAKRNRKSK